MSERCSFSTLKITMQALRNRDFPDRWFYPNMLLKSTNCQYLGLKAKNKKSKTTLFSKTFEVPENKVQNFFSFLASRPRYWYFVLFTGCPAKLFTLFILQLLSSWCTEDFHPGHFPTALFVGCWKLSKILKIEQYLTKLWRKYLQRHKIKNNNFA